MKKLLLAMSATLLLAACGDKPAEPATPEPEVTTTPVTTTEAMPSDVGVATDDTAIATAEDEVVVVQ